MLGYLTRRQRMKGGLYLGPPGWAPGAIEGLDAGEPGEKKEGRALPEERDALIALLGQIGLGKMSPILPSLAEQLGEMGGRRMRALVLNLLPTQPEYALAAALSEA